VEGISVTHYEARRQFATCGVLTVEKTGTIVTDLILCGRLMVRGRVKGKIESQGPVLIGRDAEVNGDVSAPALAVGAGAVLKGRYEIGPKNAEGGMG
jgi:cytoskeletal protein CcmA (bactofilin family)